MKILKVPRLILKWTLVTVLVATSAYFPANASTRPYRGQVYGQKESLWHLLGLLDTKVSEVPVDEQYVFNNYEPIKNHLIRNGTERVISELGYGPENDRIDKALDSIAKQHWYLYWGLRRNLSVGLYERGNYVGGLDERQYLMAFILEFAVLYRLAANGNVVSVLNCAKVIEEMSYQITKALKRYPLANRQKAQIFAQLITLGLELGKQSISKGSEMDKRLAESGVRDTLQALSKSDLFQSRFRRASHSLLDQPPFEILMTFLFGAIVGEGAVLGAAMMEMLPLDHGMYILIGTFVASGLASLKLLTLTNATRNSRPVNRAAEQCFEALTAPLEEKKP